MKWQVKRYRINLLKGRDKLVPIIPTLIVKVLKEIKAGIALCEEELEFNFFLVFSGPSTLYFYQIREDEMGSVSYMLTNKLKYKYCV